MTGRRLQPGGESTDDVRLRDLELGDVRVREVELGDVRVRRVELGDAAALVAILNPIIAARTYTVLDEPLTVAAEAESLAVGADGSVVASDVVNSCSAAAGVGAVWIATVGVAAGSAGVAAASGSSSAGTASRFTGRREARCSYARG